MGRSCSCQVCMRMRGEQSWGMHVKWGDGGDLGKSVYKVDILYDKWLPYKWLTVYHKTH